MEQKYKHCKLLISAERAVRRVQNNALTQAALH